MSSDVLPADHAAALAPGDLLRGPGAPPGADPPGVAVAGGAPPGTVPLPGYDGGRPRPGWARRAWRGRPDDPAWVRPALLTLLGATALLYLWDLGASGWANSFYSAAVQAGTRSWKAFFFGSSDAASFITVDKPPAALWVMELSARIFGVNAWSILVPQALEGVASVALLYSAVRRAFRPGAALLAGLVLATTPVAALMFRYNNPDALLVLLLTAAAYATVRALERAGRGWLVLAMAAVGTGFITKMMQAFLVVPALVLVYLVAAPTSLRRRLWQLAVATAALVVSSGWWVAAVALTPAADRPYVGGSRDNSILNLIFGYNGFGRLSGSESGSVGGAGPAGSMWGPTGWTRFFSAEFGGQISWLIPGAAILALACAWLWRRRGRSDRARASLAIWGGWLVVTMVVISFARGIIHPYYSVALAPAIGALVGIGAATLWAERHRPVARGALALSLAATSVWAFAVLERTPQWLPWLRTTVLAVGLGAALLVAVTVRRGPAAALLGALGVGVALAAPAAYALDTAATPHNGAIPSAGPASSSGPGGPGGGRGGLGRPGAFAGPGGAGAPGAGRPGVGLGAAGGSNAAGPGGPGGAGSPGGPGGGVGPPNTGGVPGASPGAAARGGAAGAAGGPGGGFLSASTPGRAVVRALESDASRYVWVAATVNSNSAAGYQLATDDPVMAVGGFNGTDPAPTLAQFETYVAEGKIHYFIAGGGGPGTGGTGTTASEITSWVESHFSAQTVSGVTLYDLAAAR